MLTEKDYCDYDTCVALYKLGYDCQVIHLIAEKITLYEAQKWLREEKLIEVNASFDKMEDGWIAFIQRLDYPDLCGTDVFSTVYNTYETALLVSIKEAVKILKEELNEET
jgi:hypothetical protein